MRAKHDQIYQLVNTDYHESVDSYVPRTMDFHDLVARKMPASWELRRQGIWFHCGSARNKLPDQGWKIHISAVRDDAREILDRVSTILFAAGDGDFKFALDIPALFQINGKNWPRSASGKFITIYPSDSGRFLELIEQLHAATRQFQGPYVLSDHRYKDSHVVFYRYGGMRLNEAVNVTGEKTHMLVGPDGVEVPDLRMAYPNTPEWAQAESPVPEQSHIAEGSFILCDGKYEIEGVLGFSSAGGVYRGRDRQTGTQVVIKEARPHIETSYGNEAVTLLKKEHRLLTLLADTGIAPQAIDLFQEGTHWFLVEEYIKGLSLSAHSASNNILLRTRASEEDYRVWYQKFRETALRLSEMVRILHSRNIVFSDLSTNNLIVTEGDAGLKVIDFEGAHEVGVEPPTGLFTPGFASPRMAEGAGADFKDDIYSMGAVLLAYLLPVNSFFLLNPQAREEFVASILRDARFPKSVGKMILDLVQPEAVYCPDRANLIAMLPQDSNVYEPSDQPERLHNYGSVVDDIARHILEAADYGRRDRLFPADAKVFTTNPLSLAHGASGIAYALKKITGSVPQVVMDWVLSSPVNIEKYAPGLYMGLSGIAWALLEAGEGKQAEKLFRLASQHRLLNQTFDLFHGMAGWGMTSLHFFLETGNEWYLQQALHCGDRLLKNHVGVSGKLPAQGARALGLAHGDSGVALYLLYLYLATGEERFLAKGKEALESDLAAGIATQDGGLAWGADVDSQSTIYPYWRYGSAGVGTTVVRYCKALGESAYADVMEKIFIDADRKHAVLPGRFLGLSGIGTFMLDAWTFTGNQKYLNSAHQIASSVMRFAIRQRGVAFPGDSLSKLSCDYGTGSAGVALFLNRLMGMQGPDFMLDRLLYQNEQERRSPFLQPDASLALA